MVQIREPAGGKDQWAGSVGPIFTERLRVRPPGTIWPNTRLPGHWFQIDQNEPDALYSWWDTQIYKFVNFLSPPGHPEGDLDAQAPAPPPNHHPNPRADSPAINVLRPRAW